MAKGSGDRGGSAAAIRGLIKKFFGRLEVLPEAAREDQPSLCQGITKIPNIHDS